MIPNEQDEEEEFCKYICWKYSQFPLLELWKFLGTKDFLRFIDHFAGSTVRIPTSKSLIQNLQKLKVYFWNLKEREKYINLSNDLRRFKPLKKGRHRMLRNLGYSNTGVIWRTIKSEIKAMHEWWKSLERLDKNES